MLQFENRQLQRHEDDLPQILPPVAPGTQQPSPEHTGNKKSGTRYICWVSRPCPDHSGSVGGGRRTLQYRPEYQYLRDNLQTTRPSYPQSYPHSTCLACNRRHLQLSPSHLPTDTPENRALSCQTQLHPQRSLGAPRSPQHSCNAVSGSDPFELHAPSVPAIADRAAPRTV